MGNYGFPVLLLADMNKVVKASKPRHHRQTKAYRAYYEARSNELDPITGFVSRFCRAPMAGVSVVDNDQVLLKSRVGLSIDRFSRSGAFCAHAVDSKVSFFEVADTRHDSRFRDSPLVRGEPHVRSYAAAVLIDANKARIGTLWVMDRVPRRLARRQRCLLVAMSRHVMAVLSLLYEDHATGLPNRRGFLEVLQPLLETWRRESVEAVLVAFQIRELPLLRDTCGWERTDQFLSELAQSMRALCRFQDEFCARCGDDQFVLTLRLLAGGGVDTTLKRLACLVDAPFRAHRQVLNLHLRLGVAKPFGRAISAVDLLDEALLAAQQATLSGAAVSYCGADGTHARRRELGHVQRVKAAFAAGEFVPHFQPQIDLAAGCISGFEVLARWQAREGEHMQLPEAFLSAFEIAECLQDLDLAIVDQACAHLRRWLDSGLAVPRLLCNLSRATIGQAGFLAAVDRVLARHLVPSQGIGFELTESHILREPVRARVLLDSLRARGIYLALDDFGTGYSNLLALNDWPVDCIKVDRSFVRAVDTDSRSQNLLHLLLGMSRSLGCAVVCEGVETEAHLAWLSAAGDSYLQGWYFAEALSPDLVPRLAPLFVRDAGLGKTPCQRARSLAARIHDAVGVLPPA